MKIDKLDFYYDLPSHIFHKIDFSAAVDISPEASAEEKRRSLLQAFKSIEAYFDGRLLTNKYCKKTTLGRESSHHISAGFSYGAGWLSSRIDCQFECYFIVSGDVLEIPTIRISLEAPDNYNYWLLEHLLGSLPWELPDEANKSLVRIREKMIPRAQDVSPLRFLEKFGTADRGTQVDANDSEEIVTATSGKNYFAESEAMLSAEWEAVIKAVAKRK